MVGIRPFPLILLWLLLVQFLLGMAVNLFVMIPTDHPGANPPEYFGGVVQSLTWAVLHGPPLLILHTAFGLVLAVTALGCVVQAIRSGPRAFALWSVVGALGVLVAGFNGGSFLNYNEDFSSMIMAAGFALAVAAYAAAVYVGPSRSRI